ncbi:hypothetical protein [Sphingomonas abietis]|uniref:Anti-sigma factor n=1 Tax=Sphingomonas abietis TaxID=3012344 RepID=A0ABY7NVS8_9SPHN|nr:hypothetical protein [Sphingomonas abietis]WBO24014.1 hypothetical protein PBT88_07865 [Sphingomonas abietis]
MDDDQPDDTPRPLPRRKPAPVISLVAVRAEQAQRIERPPRHRLGWAMAIAVVLLAGLVAGHRLTPTTIGDSDDALILSPAIARALDSRLSGQPGSIGVALSFRDRGGSVCRSFVAQHLGGVACRSHGLWLLRYAAPVDPQHDDFSLAGGDPASAQAIAAMMAGHPLDRAAEQMAIARGWR